MPGMQNLAGEAQTGEDSVNSLVVDPPPENYPNGGAVESIGITEEELVEILAGEGNASARYLHKYCGLEDASPHAIGRILAGIKIVRKVNGGENSRNIYQVDVEARKKWIKGGEI